MGRDKAWLPFGQDATLLARMVRLITELVEDADIVVVAAHGQELPELESSVQVARDRWPDEGPLLGMATGMSALPAQRKWVLVCSCDLPLLRPEVLALLRETARQSDSNLACDAVVPRVEGKWQPLTAIYRAALLPAVNGLLQRGERRMTDLLESIGVRELREEELLLVDPTLASFRHCNTPEEYASLLAAAND